MIYYAECRVLITVLRQGKDTVLDYEIWGKLPEPVYRSRIRDVRRLKSRLIEKWEHFHQVFIDEAIRQWRQRL